MKICISMILAIMLISCASEAPAQPPAEIDNAEVNFSNDNLGLQIENIPEGIRFTFDNIPEDVTTLFINIYEGEYNPAQWSDVFAAVLGPRLDELKVTKQLVCPFVKKDQQYAISIELERNKELDPASKLTESIQGQNGNYITNNIDLKLNDEQTGVALSAEPEFSVPVEYGSEKYEYILLFFPDESSSVSAGIYSGNELSCLFFPETTNVIKEDLKEQSSKIEGDFPAYVAAVCNINYKDIWWMLCAAKTEEFTLSL